MSVIIAKQLLYTGFALTRINRGVFADRMPSGIGVLAGPFTGTLAENSQLFPMAAFGQGTAVKSNSWGDCTEIVNRFPSLRKARAFRPTQNALTLLNLARNAELNRFINA